MNISRANLRGNHAGTMRLARWLRLRIDGMSPRQVTELVYWRITRHRRHEKGWLYS